MTSQTINSIEAAKMEAAGTGSFQIVGRSIRFQSEGREFSWHCSTPKQAREHLNLFRSSIKYVG
jgi:hypothetical protein